MYKRFMLTGVVIILVLNLAAWLIPELCDWYTLYITPVWVNTYGRFSDIFSFSLGEIMLVFAVCLMVLSVIIGILWILLRKKSLFNAFAVRYFKAISYITLFVCMIMTLNCTIMYHCSPLDPNTSAADRDYTIDELETLRNYIVEQCNMYSIQVARDNNGYVIYDGDMQEEAKRALNNLSDTYPKLKGYYPDVKGLRSSDFMSQAYIAGYYFPFSMEANCNTNMYITNYPEVYCHELAHLHGYIYEDEANFISFLACILSDDVFFKYCGYLGVLNYIDNAYFESIDGNVEIYSEQSVISEIVYNDNVFLLSDTWRDVEETAIFATADVDKASDAFTETVLKLNGVREGIASYDAVVGLLLKYYDGELY